MTARRHGIDWRLAPAGAFLFILPFSHTVALRLACLFLAAVVALQATWRQERPDLPCRWPLALWAAVCALSLAWSIDPAYSRKELTNEVGYSLLAFLTFFYLTRDERSWRFWKAALAAGCAAASLAAIGHLVRIPLWPDDGLVGGRNEFSTYVALVMPLLAVSFAQAGRRRERLAVLAIAVLAAGSAYFTLNRTMWLALFAEAAILGWLHAGRSAATGRRRAARTFILLAACIAFAGAFVAASQMKSGAEEIDAQTLRATVERDLRWQIWSYGIERIGERPLLGHGYCRGILRDDFRAHIDNPFAWHAHSVILNYALEAGMVGVVVLFVLAGCFARTFWKLYRAPERGVWMAGAFGLALLLGAAVKTATDDIVVRENALLFWSLAGMGLGYARHASMRPRDRDEPAA